MSVVYFTKELSGDAVLRLYRAVGKTLSGKVAVKLHSGEAGNQNFLGPDFWRPMIEDIGGTVTECNTAYGTHRATTKNHIKLLKEHGWSDAFDVDLMDAEGPDAVFEIPDGLQIKKNYVGKNLLKYDSLLVLSHFKGHPMGGYGGALKQLSIGIASAYGKAYIHGSGVPEEKWTADHDSFLRSMADAASSVVKHFDGKAVYINVLKNLSVDCDCCAQAEDPCMADIGIVASTDPVAIDCACLDLVYSSTDKGRDHFVERVETRNGKLTPLSAEKIGIGSTTYTLINLDK